MIFNKSGKLLNDKFLLGNEQLENTNSYTYLGLTFVPSGKFNTAIDTLCKKASKAMFKLRKSIHTLNLPPRPELSMVLYDTLIWPICTYAAEVWGSFIKEKDQVFNTDCTIWTLW